MGHFFFLLTFAIDTYLKNKNFFCFHHYKIVVIMIKKIATALLATITASGISAATLTPGEALARLEGNGMSKVVSGLKTGKLSHCYTATSETSQPSLYVFNRDLEGGFLIVSADDAITPLLGYADNGIFDPENIPDNLKYWLEEYTRQISWATSSPESAKTKYSLTNIARNENAERSPIAPLVKTTWDQEAPYNGKCPTYNQEICPTGCVATCVAQVMKTFNYPLKGTGKLSYNWTYGNRKLSIDFSNTSFDWANMLDSYAGDYTDAQANAVATLMQAVGYATKMNYAPGSSGTPSAYIIPALYDYLGYSSAMNYQQRIYYTRTEWEDLIYNSIAAGSPVCYGGSAYSGGHSFVCDGYDKDGYFHFNWGWSGIANGYFLMDALDPTYQGTGGFEGGYNFTQDAILDIRPAAESDQPSKKVLSQTGYTTARWDSDKKILSVCTDQGNYGGWYNMTGYPMTVSVVVRFQPLDSEGKPTGEPYLVVPPKTKLYDYTKLQVDNMMGMPKFDADIENIPDGKYLVNIGYKNLPDNDDTDWETPLYNINQADYVYITIENREASITDVTVPGIEVSDFKINTPFYLGSAIKLSVTVTNPTDREITRAVAPAVFTQTGGLLAQGSGFYLTLKPGESVTRDWTDTPVFNSATYQEQTVEIILYDPETAEIYNEESPITVKLLSAAEFEAETDALIISNATMTNGIYSVGNPAEITFNTDITCTHGFIGMPLSVIVADRETNRIITSTDTQVPFISKDEKAQLSCVLRFPQAEEGRRYYAVLGILSYSSYGTTFTPLMGSSTNIDPKCVADFIVDPTGVNEISSESNENIKVTLRGMEVYADTEAEVYDAAGNHIGVVTSDKPLTLPMKGLYIIHSATKTVKVIL